MPTSETPVVLVIEDDPPVRGLLSDVLEGEGYEVVAVHDGSTALQVIASLQVDLITLDLDLPGLSGSDLLEVLRRRKGKIPPVIVVTSTKPVLRRTRQMAQLVVNKPFDIDELLQGALDLLPRRLPRAEARLREMVARADEHQRAHGADAETEPGAPTGELQPKRGAAETSRSVSGLSRLRRRPKSRRRFTDDGTS